MEMKDVRKLMDEYFQTVSPEQFEQDLLDAGLACLPDAVMVEFHSEPIPFEDMGIAHSTIFVDSVLREAQHITTVRSTVSAGTYEVYGSSSEYVFKEVA